MGTASRHGPSPASPVRCPHLAPLPVGWTHRTGSGSDGETQVKPQSTHACLSDAVAGLSGGSWAVEETTEVLAEGAGSRLCPRGPLHQKEI